MGTRQQPSSRTAEAPRRVAANKDCFTTGYSLRFVARLMKLESNSSVESCRRALTQHHSATGDILSLHTLSLPRAFQLVSVQFGLTCLRSMPNTLSTVAMSAGHITASSPRTSHCTGAPGFKRNAAQISGGTMVNFFADVVAGRVTAPGAVRNNCIAAYGSSKPRGHFRRASSSEPHQERLSVAWCTRPHRHLRLVDSALPRPAINCGGIVVVQHDMVN